MCIRDSPGDDREGQKGVGDAHGQQVRQAGGVTADDAHGNADERRRQRHDQPEAQRRTRAPDEGVVHVPLDVYKRQGHNARRLGRTHVGRQHSQPVQRGDGRPQAGACLLYTSRCV